jgi:hypothetical protein
MRPEMAFCRFFSMDIQRFQFILKTIEFKITEATPASPPDFYNH